MWLAGAFVFIIIELFTSGFAIACFAAGALAGMILAVFPAPVWMQVLAFASGTLLAFIFIRPAAIKYLHRSDTFKTGVDALVGRSGKVSEAIPAGGYGRVAIDGDDWKAATEDGSAVEKGENVEIIAVNSVILTVKKK